MPSNIQKRRRRKVAQAPFQQVERQARQQHEAFQKRTDVEAIVESRFENQQVGVLVLGKKARRRQLQFVFGFATHGFHNHLDEETAEQHLNKLHAGVQSLPGPLRIECRKIADDRHRQQQLNQQLGQAPAAIYSLEVFSDKRRIQELTQQGYRQQQQITLYATCSVEGDESSQTGVTSLVEKTLQQLEQRVNPDAAEVQAAALEEHLHQLYYQHYQDWLNCFQTLGLSVTPLNATQLWQRAVNQVCPAATHVNQGNTSLPQLLTIDETGLQETQTTARHPSLYLTRHGVPEAHPAYIKRGDTYTGVVTMMDKPEGFASAKHQLSYLFNVLAHPAVRDTDIIVEFSRANSNLHRAALQLQNRQLNTQINRAQDQDADDVGASLNAEDTIAAQRALIQGAIPLSIGMAVLVHRPNPQALSVACNQVISQFGGTWMVREDNLAYKAWLQTLLVTRQKVLHYQPFDQRLLYLSSEATGLMPLLNTRPHDQHGVELISEQGSAPFYLDFIHPHSILGRRTLAIFGATRSGKSLLTAKILFMALLEGLPVTIVDYPKPDGTSTFTDFTRLLGGSYVDIARQSLNVLELPDLAAFTPEEQAKRLDEFCAVVLPILRQLVLSSTPVEQLPVSAEAIKSVLQLTLQAYRADPAIQERTRLAHEQGLGTTAWQAIPTLRDYINLLTPETIHQGAPNHRAKDESPEITKALSYCSLRLNTVVQTPGVGKAISQPSSIDASTSLMVFALTNVQDPEDAAILAMVANVMALRRALAHPASIVFIDESPILLQFPALSLMLGRLCANGLKAGIAVILAAQDPDTIAKSKAGQQILQNLNTQLIGRIQRTALPSFEQYLNIPQEVLEPNASEGFFPNPQSIYSNWLVNDGGTFTRARFYPSPILLALTANNPDEQQARTKVLEQFVAQPLEGLAAFAQLLTQALRSGVSLTTVVTQWLAARHTED